MPGAPPGTSAWALLTAKTLARSGNPPLSHGGRSSGEDSPGRDLAAPVFLLLG